MFGAPIEIASPISIEPQSEAICTPRFTEPACKKDLKIDTCEGNVGGGEEYHQDWARGLRGEGPAGSCAP